MRSLKSFLSVCSFLLFVISYPELHGPLAILLFFVIIGFMHYVLWGRALSRAVRAEAVPELPPAVQYPSDTTDYTDYTEPAR